MHETSSPFSSCECVLAFWVGYCLLYMVRVMIMGFWINFCIRVTQTFAKIMSCCLSFTIHKLFCMSERKECETINQTTCCERTLHEKILLFVEIFLFSRKIHFCKVVDWFNKLVKACEMGKIIFFACYVKGHSPNMCGK